MNAVWLWLVEHWDTIRLVLLAVVGLVAYIWARYQGDVMKFALMVWAGILELAHEGLDSVDEEIVRTLSEPVWAILVASKMSFLVRIFLTEAKFHAIVWDLWCWFRDTLKAPAASTTAGRAAAFNSMVGGRDDMWFRYLEALDQARYRMQKARRMTGSSGMELFAHVKDK